MYYMKNTCNVTRIHVHIITILHVCTCIIWHIVRGNQNFVNNILIYKESFLWKFLSSTFFWISCWEYIWEKKYIHKHKFDYIKLFALYGMLHVQKWPLIANVFIELTTMINAVYLTSNLWHNNSWYLIENGRTAIQGTINSEQQMNMLTYIVTKNSTPFNEMAILEC